MPNGRYKPYYRCEFEDLTITHSSGCNINSGKVWNPNYKELSNFDKVVNKIVDEFGPLFVKRSSGFSRMIRLGKRRGDDAMMVKLELIEKPVTKVIEEKAIVAKAKDKKEQPVTKTVKTKKK